LYERAYLNPVSFFYKGGLTCPVFLCLQFFLEFSNIHCQSLFPGHKDGKVKREPIGVVQEEGVLAAELFQCLVTDKIFK